MSYTTIEIEEQDAIATVWLNRPDLHNAINDTMIADLTAAFTQLSNNSHIRIILLKGRGKSFCAGADLNWMRSAANNTPEENSKESEKLALCFNTIYNAPKATIAIVHGAAMGGANGLLSACDFAYCTDDTTFSLSEVKLGLIPATIGPYVIKRVGEFVAKDIMLTGRRFKGQEAAALHLVNKSVADAIAIESMANDTVQQLLTSGPGAITSCKKLIQHVVETNDTINLMSYTADAIAQCRKSLEAQEGMTAFLEKRKPNWIQE